MEMEMEIWLVSSGPASPTGAVQQGGCTPASLGVCRLHARVAWRRTRSLWSDWARAVSLAHGFDVEVCIYMDGGHFVLHLMQRELYDGSCCFPCQVHPVRPGAKGLGPLRSSNDPPKSRFFV